MNGADGGGGGVPLDRGRGFAADPDHVFASKHFGVSRYKDGWKGTLYIDGAQHMMYHLGGAFDTEEEAHLAVEAAKVRLGWKPAAKAAKQSGMKGVRWHKNKQKWQAEVKGELANRLNGGKYKGLGSFDDVEDAKRTLTAWIAARENGEVRCSRPSTASCPVRPSARRTARVRSLTLALPPPHLSARAARLLTRFCRCRVRQVPSPAPAKAGKKAGGARKKAAAANGGGGASGGGDPSTAIKKPT
eukprot:COSAG01_NODE_4249_length_5207_cov_3.508319_1_plen_244_part_10